MTRKKTDSKKPTKLELASATEASKPPSTASPKPDGFKAFEDRVIDILLKAECYQHADSDPGLKLTWGSREKPEKESWLYVEWETGGASGGSCWGGEAHSYSTSNTPEELTSLDLILTEFKPDMSFLQYKVLTAKIVQNDSRSVNEYYGNHTDYAMKKVRLRDLYDYMVAQGWIA
jgi:hypothetical protein